MGEYERLQERLAQGWNTWNTRSVLSHVLLPEGFALNLGIREYYGMRYLKEALIGRKRAEEEQVRPGLHAYDGSYSELTLAWQGMELRVESAREGSDLVLLVNLLKAHPQVRKAPLLVVEGGILWNRAGYVSLEGEHLTAHLHNRTNNIWGTRLNQADPHIAAQTPYLSMPLDGAAGVSTGQFRTLTEIQAIITKRRAEFTQHFAAYGELAEVYKAIQTAIAWDTIYEPEHRRVVTPVSRIWNVGWGGYVLFDWDNYFAAWMAALESKELAYANAVEMTRGITEAGFVPNFETVSGVKSRDRSEPPVGALVCRELYRQFGETWFLEEVYPSLLRWNRWWHAQRSLDGLLCWGSDPYEPVVGAMWEFAEINQRQGGAWESGLDNLPTYDDVPFDPQSHLLLSQDVGLSALYAADCTALAEIAAVLGRAEEAAELGARGEAYRKALGLLWDESTGIYRNRDPRTGALSAHLAPTSFYPLLAGAATTEQAERMVREHFYNPDEFWGEYIIPAIARNDPAYKEQNYWRGRIWGPMNLLAYLSLRQAGMQQACRDLAEKSVRLLMKEWLEKGHVHENYNGDTGEGCDAPNSDAFYHWGGLLGMIALIEEGDSAGA
jgi:putative isomerase